MIRIDLKIEHGGGAVNIVEYDPHQPTSAEEAKRMIKACAERAAKRAQCAISGEEYKP